MASYRAVSKKKLNNIVSRLQHETVAQKASKYDFDPQDCHLAYMRQRDPRALSAHSNQTSSESFEEIVGRLTRPTTASQAARHDFDAQACHIDYLKQTLSNYPPPKKTASTEELNGICEKLTKPTAASKAARYDFDAQKEHVLYLQKQDPKYPGHKKYGFRTRSAPFRNVVSTAELEELVVKWTKPTVASEGGKPLANKDFTYIEPRKSKTCPEIKGLDKKFRGERKLTSEDLASSVTRLNTPFKRFQETQTKVRVR